MKSMTGFGTSQFQVKGLSSQVTVRSVNGRYLEIRTHLPKELQNLEFELKAQAKKYFQRGTVDISFQFSPSDELNQHRVDLDIELAKEWLLKAKRLKSSLKIVGDLEINSLVNLPGVLRHHKVSKLKGNEAGFLKGALKAFKLCEAFRKKEGVSLKKVILATLSDLESCCQNIRGEQKKVENAISQALRADIENEVTLEGRSVLEAKACEALERMNVEEELVRLAEHIKAVKKLAGTSDPVGKKMDFYAQELLREMNTVGSKSASSHITGLVVQGKSWIENFREQVQNIE